MIVCPDHCAEGHRKRQTNLSNFEREELPESAQKVIAVSKGIARRCEACGCVYINDDEGQHILGYLDGGVSGKGWSSSKYQ